MKAYIYDSEQEAERIARTMDRMGLECSVVGSAVLALSGDYKLLVESVMAPEPTVVADVVEVA